MAVLSVNAQTMKIYKGNVLVATYSANEADKVVFAEAENGKVTFDFQLKSKTHNTITFSVKPSDPETPYYLGCEKIGYVSQFATDEELVNEELAYWYNKYGTTYASYGFESYQELFLLGVCEKGEYEAYVVDKLDPETTYVGYLFSVDPETLEPTSDLYKVEVTTEASPELSWTLLGTGKYQEGFLAGFFTGLDTKEIDVEIYQDANKEGVYAMKNPYGPEMLCNWWYDETVSKEMIEAYEGEANNVWKETFFTFTINSDNTVDVPVQDLGMYMRISDYAGWPIGGIPSTYEMSGTYADGVITAPTKGAVLGLGDELFYGNMLGTLKITMPVGSAKAKAVKNPKEKIGKKLHKVKDTDIKNHTKVKMPEEAEAFDK